MLRLKKCTWFTVNVCLHPPALFHCVMYRYFSGYLVPLDLNISSCTVPFALSLPPAHPLPRGRAHPLSQLHVHVRFYSRKCCQMPSIVNLPLGLIKCPITCLSLKYVLGGGTYMDSKSVVDLYTLTHELLWHWCRFSSDLDSPAEGALLILICIAKYL